MTTAEAKRLVVMLSASWPRQEIQQATLEVYALALADLDHGVAKAAVLQLMQTSRFFPTIAEIREAAVQTRVSLPTPEEAWGVVHRAIGKHGSYREPLFDCDEIQLATDAIGWQELCLGEHPAANRARWLDAYRGFVSRRLSAEARGKYVPPERQLGPEAKLPVLVETGYASPRADDEPEPTEATTEARSLVQRLADGLGGRR